MAMKSEISEAALSRVLEFIPPARIRSAAAPVCSRWFAAARAEALWARLCARRAGAGDGALWARSWKVQFKRGPADRVYTSATLDCPTSRGKRLSREFRETCGDGADDGAAAARARRRRRARRLDEAEAADPAEDPAEDPADPADAGTLRGSSAETTAATMRWLLKTVGFSGKLTAFATPYAATNDPMFWPLHNLSLIHI